MVLRTVVVWIVLVVLTHGSGWATIRNVNNQVSCNDSGCAPCCTIQAAIELSSGGDVVRVADGTYPENLDFRDMASVGDITLETASVPGAVLVSPATGHVVRHDDGYTNTVTIDGLEFTVSEVGASCVYLAHAGDVVLRNVTANQCGYTAFVLDNTGTVTLEDCTANQSQRHGIQVDQASAVTLDGCTTNSNTMSGVLVINVAGAVEIIGPTSNDNTTHGIDLDLTGPLTISGATITGNDERGIWAQSTSTVTITSSTVSGSNEDGVRLDTAGGADRIAGVTLNGLEADNNGVTGSGNGAYVQYVSGPVTVTDSSFDGNSGAGLELFDSTFDALQITGGSANSNGGNGVRVKGVEGPVTISGLTTNSNSLTGVRVDAAKGKIVIEDCVSNLGLEEGIKIDADKGPVTVEHCTLADNALEGLKIQRETDDVTSIAVALNTFTGNGDSGVALSGLLGAGPFEAMCNDFMGNGEGLYLNSPVTVDATLAWWGDVTGPSGLGSGSGDSIVADSGTVLYDPWLAETCAGCNGVVNLTLQDGSVDSMETHKACFSITVGPSYAVYGPDGHLDLTAPQVEFTNGFSVEVDGALTVRHP